MTNHFNIQLVNTSPIITAANIANGFITRYFVAKANQINTTVYEVNARQYDNLEFRQYIVGVIMNWTIKGPLDNYTINVYTGIQEDIEIPGVMHQNKGAVEYHSQRIPILMNTLTNYSQYYRGD